MPTIPKPTALKVLQGNPGKRAINHNEPKPPMEPLTPPDWLPDEGKTIFHELEAVLNPMHVLTVADSLALVLLSDCLAQYKDCRKFIIENGHTYESINESGAVLIRTRPEVSMCADAWKRAKSMMVEFGLTPSSRTRLKVNKPEEDDSFDAFMKDKR